MTLPSAPVQIGGQDSPVAGGSLRVFQSGPRRTLQLDHWILSVWSADPADTFGGLYWGQCMQMITRWCPGLSSILILGLGGGTLAHLLQRHYRPRILTGVEIDPAVTALGRKYLYLDTIPGLTVIQDDAVRWLRARTSRSHACSSGFDLVVADVFSGGIAPGFSRTKGFLNGIRDVLAPGGLFCWHRLISPPGRVSQAACFVREILQPSFARVLFHACPADKPPDHVLFWAWKKED